MNRRSMNGFIIVILTLGGIGLLATLVRNPMWLLQQIAFYAVIAGIIFLIYRYAFQKRIGRGNSAYEKAVKQSKRRFDDRDSKVKSISQARKNLKKGSALKKKKQTHLTVIEGKKGKKKNRAFF
ncbi:SA1362 family protein [Metabacillus fastidiosus]|uniref:SA1362 family protein n=1 Tax=Metabacillus fastidiosus TaxID=1458 RepID=UPI002DB86F6A|nr:SA1362 family protein [Metabacillus fastidiosus]MEC2075397.1 SA1362 family protein [Metabacillus fastidiosus]MED4453527.1 SA1362 family protein [Metabacillus fastidiosus]